MQATWTRLTLGSALMTLALVLSATPANAAIMLSGDYDPADANNVDQSGTFASGTGGGSAANLLNLATFKPLVGQAYSLGTGGVMPFGQPGDALEGTNELRSTPFGTGNYTVSATNTVGTVQLATGTFSGNRVPTSGGVSGGSLSKLVGSELNLSLALNGGAPGEGVTHFGLTMLHRQATTTWSATANFSGGGSVTTNPIAFNAADTANTRDTFFGFAAPAGETISSVRFFSSTNSFTNFDDLGFITNVAPVPEPGTFVLALLGATGVWVAARRKRAAARRVAR